MVLTSHSDMWALHSNCMVFFTVPQINSLLHNLVYAIILQMLDVYRKTQILDETFLLFPSHSDFPLNLEPFFHQNTIGVLVLGTPARQAVLCRRFWSILGLCSTGGPTSRSHPLSNDQQKCLQTPWNVHDEHESFPACSRSLLPVSLCWHLKIPHMYLTS